MTLVLVLWTVSGCTLWSSYASFRSSKGGDGGGAPGAPPAGGAPARPARSLFTPFFSVCSLAFVVLSLLAVACVAQLRADVSVFVYDPWRDLELPPNTWDGRAIKGAYRKLSLQYHPDKMPGGDAKRFQAISRAHYALTDDTGKRNFLERGNPEGTFVNVGELPAWLPTDSKALAGASFVFILGVLGAVGYAGFAVIQDRPRANKAAGFVSEVDKLAALSSAERLKQRKAAKLNYDNGRVTPEALADFYELLDEAEKRAIAAGAASAAKGGAAASATRKTA